MQSELFIVFIVREPSQRTPLTFLKHLFVHVFADLTKRKRRLLRSRLLRLGLFYGTFWIWAGINWQRGSFTEELLQRQRLRLLCQLSLYTQRERESRPTKSILTSPLTCLTSYYCDNWRKQDQRVAFPPDNLCRELPDPGGPSTLICSFCIRSVVVHEFFIKSSEVKRAKFSRWIWQ